MKVRERNKAKVVLCETLRDNSIIRDGKIEIDFHGYQEGYRLEWNPQAINYCPWCGKLVGEKRKGGRQITQLRLHKTNAEYNLWTLVAEKFCCPKLKKYAVCFPDNERFSLAESVGLWLRIIGYDPEGPGRFGKYTILQINYCPWCGEKIEVEVKK